MRALLLSLTALAMASSAPAFAAVVIDFDNVKTDENVLFAGSTNVASTTLIANTNQSNAAVTFNNMLGLFANASGQSSTTSSSDGLFGMTSVTIADGFGFSTASFNLPGISGNAPPVEATSVLVEVLGLNGSVIESAILALSGAGENRIGISGTAGEQFSGFRLSFAPSDGGVEALTQVRLGGVGSISAVPEPATWGMMIMGFALMGAAMRRKDRSLRVRYS